MKVLHVIPVPAGMTPEEAYAEIEVMGEFIEYDPDDDRFRFPECWAVIEVDD